MSMIHIRKIPLNGIQINTRWIGQRHFSVQVTVQRSTNSERKILNYRKIHARKREKKKHITYTYDSLQNQVKKYFPKNQQQQQPYEIIGTPTTKLFNRNFIGFFLVHSLSLISKMNYIKSPVTTFSKRHTVNNLPNKNSFISKVLCVFFTNLCGIFEFALSNQLQQQTIKEDKTEKKIKKKISEWNQRKVAHNKSTDRGAGSKLDYDVVDFDELQFCHYKIS